MHLPNLLKTFIICACLSIAPVPFSEYKNSITPAYSYDNLDEKIGQMIMVGFRGLNITEKHPIIDDIRKHRIGGVILFDYDIPTKKPVRNIQNPVQLKNLISTLQKEALNIPLFIAIDQEGGQISRLKEKFGFEPTLSAKKLGEIDDIDLTRKNAEIISQNLYNLGFNVNFAPVVDLNVNRHNPIIGKLERSFSSKPEIVSRHAKAFIDVHKEYGIITTLKHFPGHGSSINDSHKGFVDVTNTWSERELEPFKQLITHGFSDMIMTSHTFNRKLDPSFPATLSKDTINNILRDKLKFEGVIISDDMQMKAISENYNFKTAIQLAINSGIDILLFGNNTPYDENIAMKTFNTIKNLVVDGKITRERINQSFYRIQKLKRRIDLSLPVRKNNDE